MSNAIANYVGRFVRDFGNGWTRFWFLPSDAATLSLIRLLTGLVAVYLHATLSFDLVTLFGPNGMLPVADIADLEAGTFSYLNYLSTPGELWTAHLLGLAVLVAFAAGFRTRITSVLALLVFLSDVQRAPMITGRTESIVAMVMLYLCLGPSGELFSLDHWLAKKQTAPRHSAPAATAWTSATIAIRLIQVHLCLLVAMIGFSLLAGESWWSGLGIWWLIGRADSRFVDFTFLHTSPRLLDAWTHTVVAFHLAFPVLIWIPLARPLLLVLGALIWTSLAMLTGEFTFAAMMVVASLAFVRPDNLRAVFGKLAS